jgi:NAD(P)-dependent dehydrogenase (short-subunit alcohol dehydrogenase family)
VSESNAVSTLRIEELFSVRDKVAVVTGGSMGVGRMIAAALAANGAKIYIVARQSQPLAEACAEIRQFGNCIGIQADIAQVKEVEKLVADVAAREERLHLLVNNAGIYREDALGCVGEEAWDEVVNLNLKGLFFLTQKLLPLLAAGATDDSWSRVINLSSITARVAYTGSSVAYAASKAGVEQLTRVLARGLGRHRITANCIAPGWFPSRLNTDFSEETKAQWIEGTPVGRVGDTADMAGLAVFLASKAASYVNGQIITIDGGHTL